MEERDHTCEILLERFLASPSDEAVREDFFAGALKVIRNISRKLAYLCPEGGDHGSFIDDVVSMASQNLLLRIHTYESRSPFEHWLATLVKSTALDERRKVTGRGKIARPYLESIEEITPSQIEKIALDSCTFRSKYWKDSSVYAEDRELQGLVDDLLRLHAQRSATTAMSAWSLSLYLWRDYTVERIAASCNISERRVWQIFAMDYVELRDSLRDNFGISKY